MMCGRRLRLDVQKNISSARPYGAPACYVCAEPLGVPHEPFVYDAQLDGRHVTKDVRERSFRDFM